PYRSAAKGMRRVVFIAAALAVLALAGLAVAYVQGYRETWIGFYDLAVRIDAPGDPPRAVSCQALAHRETAEEFCELRPGLSRRPDTDVALADPFDGRPLVVKVKMTGVRSYFGRDLHRAQLRAVVVRAEWADGRSVCRVVDIPDEWEAHEVWVPLP